jgi:hypothetical protein
VGPGPLGRVHRAGRRSRWRWESSRWRTVATAAARSACPPPSSPPPSACGAVPNPPTATMKRRDGERPRLPL